MKICNLGVIHGDMMLFGGIYSNLAALEALIEVAEQNNIRAENCICTGDIVAYCADAEKSVNLLRDFGCVVLAGNCEVQLASDEDDCGCGFDEGSECSLLSRAWYAHARKQVSNQNKYWMGGLPDRITFTHNGCRYGIVHGAASDISQFIWPVTDDELIAAEIALLKEQVGPVDHVIAGHTGIPMQRNIDGVLWTNTGAIGMPSHNGRAATHYGSLGEKGICIKDLEYNINKAIQSMKTTGLVQGYHETLRSGYWPSEDNLPQEMRQSSCANG
jgi:predicted phosphodiesterase